MFPKILSKKNGSSFLGYPKKKSLEYCFKMKNRLCAKGGGSFNGDTSFVIKHIRLPIYFLSDFSQLILCQELNLVGG